MKNRLPVYIENRELPQDKYREDTKKETYGYINILYILSLLITGVSIAIILFLG